MIRKFFPGLASRWFEMEMKLWNAANAFILWCVR